VQTSGISVEDAKKKTTAMSPVFHMQADKTGHTVGHGSGGDLTWQRVAAARMLLTNTASFTLVFAV
jgi:ABC-type lipoprotein export system ATPase subunit